MELLRHPRPWVGFGAGTALVIVVCAALGPFRDSLPSEVPAVALVLPVVVAGVVGGRLAAVAVAVEGAAALALLFLGDDVGLGMSVEQDLVALIVFLVVAVVVGGLVGTVATADRQRASAEAARVVALQELDEARSGLLRSVSHDLRTPLAVIQAVATDLRSGTAYDDATRDELLGLVGTEAERLDRIVANLLSLSRIEAGTLQPDRQAVDLGELVTSSAERMGRVLEGLAVSLDVAPDLPLVPADYSQVDQVVTNLLENAARHSTPGAPIEVTVAERATALVVTVADHGPGIPADRREEVFEPFRSGGPGSGSGVGLAICRAIVEAHGGTISAGDASGGGAAVSFSLPLDR
ncbi:MAG TPA: ATP-binding protein [Acidimicrobiales bacterium]